jgi:hypothetical protein
MAHITKPTVGGSTGTWGTILNGAIDDIHDDLDTLTTDVATAQSTADDALPKAGGVMTGRADLLTSQSKRTDLGSISGAQALNLALSNAFSMTIGGATTLSFSNVPSGTFVQGVLLKITNPAANITWPGSVKWAAGTPPTFTTAGVDLVGLVSFDAGTSWYATALLDLS